MVNEFLYQLKRLGWAAGLMIAGCSLLPACAMTTETITIEGEVVYKQRIALPADSVISIQLLDVSLQDTAAIVLAQQQTESVQNMTAFTFEVPAKDIKAGHTYAIGARIEVDGKLKFINTQRYTVNMQSPTPMTVIVNMVN